MDLDQEHRQSKARIDALEPKVRRRVLRAVALHRELERLERAHRRVVAPLREKLEAIEAPLADKSMARRHALLEESLHDISQPEDDQGLVLDALLRRDATFLGVTRVVVLLATLETLPLEQIQGLCDVWHIASDAVRYLPEPNEQVEDLPKRSAVESLVHAIRRDLGEQA